MTMSRAKTVVGSALLLGALFVHSGCSTAHNGTETGNPPVAQDEVKLNEGLIALVVSANEVHIVGKRGAVTPGGSEVEVVSNTTGKTYRGKSGADGSFDVVVDTSANDTFTVRALRGSQSSGTVVVDRGGATVGTDTDPDLTCDGVMRDALDYVSIAASNADKSCSIDADCKWQGTSTNCSDDCGTWVVSSSGAQEISQAANHANTQICPPFQQAQCRLVHPPCAPQTQTPRCIAGQCQLESSGNPTMPTTGSADCTSAFDAGSSFAAITVYWHSAQAGACLPRTYGGTGGNGNRYATRAACESACVTAPRAECPPDRIRVQACVAGSDLIACAQTAEVCAKVCSAAEQCAGDPVGRLCNGTFCDSSGGYVGNP